MHWCSFFAFWQIYIIGNSFCNGDCDYQGCNLGNDKHLNVHLVPHTHNDVGWLKTVDQYYYGANRTIQGGEVQYILDNVVQQLLLDPKKRFIYVEIAFFTRWWNEQSDEMKSQVRNLVDQGRLEFILGGWCMNDEAATHYSAMIDQMTLGLSFLNQTFGKCGRPRVAWQIDPFGHSREQASLFAQMGFDGLFFGRLDQQDKELRMKEKRMEEIWRGSASLQPPMADLFTGVNQNGYGPPNGFCFDVYCRDDPIMDNPDLEDYNVDEKVELFVKTALKQAGHYKTNHIMMTMGSDFQYSNARMWYKNLDKLIKYVNAAGENVTTFYSTPSCYLYALNRAGGSWTVKTDDFFPYAERPHSFWTGYFTSRPALKRYVRDSSNLLQVCNQLETRSPQRKSSKSSSKLRRAMGVAQHHDAVSGTSKQHVADDYAKRLFIGREECKAVISEVLTGAGDGLQFCDFLNISQCSFSETNQQFVVVLYNPLARRVNHHVRIPVRSDVGDAYDVVVDGTDSVSAELVPVGNETDFNGRPRSASHVLIFPADLPPLTFREYVVKKKSEKRAAATVQQQGERTLDDFSISNEFYRVKFDPQTGLMASIENRASKVEVEVHQDLLWYNSSFGDAQSAQQSGAYVFRPNTSDPFPVSGGGRVVTTATTSGRLVQEFHQTFSSWASQVVRLYSGAPHVEVEWTVGPIPVVDGWGKEVVTRYQSSIASEGRFYTDSNGREMLERRKDFRPTWKLNQSEPVAGNYYPVNTRMYLKDDRAQLTILTDRSQGGSSLRDGSLELMVHRRVLGEDGKGVGEALNETGADGAGLVVRGKHFLLLDTPGASAQHRLLAQQVFMSPLVAFRPLSSAAPVLVPQLKMTSLPQNVHLLTLASTDEGGVLLRVEHQFERDEDPVLSQPVTFSLKNLFVGFEPSSIRELTLGGNSLLDDVTRLTWKEDDVTRLTWKEDDVTKRHRSKRSAGGVQQFQKPDRMEKESSPSLNLDVDITLDPMQIRTFLLR